jgi:hypothetical protein
MPYAERRARMRPKPFPFEPLGAAIGAQLHVREHNGTGGPLHGLKGLVASALGVDFRHLKRAQNDGLSVLQADRYACRVNLHPAEVWPEWDLSREPEPEPPPAPSWWRS